VEEGLGRLFDHMPKDIFVPLKEWNGRPCYEWKNEGLCIYRSVLVLMIKKMLTEAKELRLIEVLLLVYNTSAIP
jgi:hypothetical protein